MTAGTLFYDLEAGAWLPGQDTVRPSDPGPGLEEVIRLATDTDTLPADPKAQAGWYRRRLQMIVDTARGGLAMEAATVTMQTAGADALAVCMQVEWAGWRISHACPACDAEKYQGNGHKPTCTLVAALKKAGIR